MNTTKYIYSWMICNFIIMAAFHAHATTVNYTLGNVILADGEQITGTFDWTYSVDDFEGGSGVFTALEIPYTIYSFADGNLNIDIQTDSIEISGNGNYHDVGLDITLKLLQPYTPTLFASIDLDLSIFECCGNGFKDQPFQSGSISPSTGLASDFDSDNDVDGADFLRWQRGFGDIYGDSDLATWGAHYGSVAPVSAVAAFATAVPEPSAGILLLLGMVTILAVRWTAVSKLNCA